MHIQQMLATHPKAGSGIGDALSRCAEACFDCAQTCTACADACLSEGNVTELRNCIALNLNCADICAAAGAITARRTAAQEEITRGVIQLCAAICSACGDECQLHAGHHEHCRICESVCRECEKSCRDALASAH